jgi:hypothetical protein
MDTYCNTALEPHRRSSRNINQRETSKPFNKSAHFLLPCSDLGSGALCGVRGRGVQSTVQYCDTMMRGVRSAWRA